MFLLILAVSIIAAIAQMISATYDMKNPAKQGISKITVAGWLFYICTFILAFMPAIQKAFQDEIDREKEIANSNEQEIRDAKLKVSYDSSLREMKTVYDTSLLVMKRKFDTTTSIVSETLGKYGYKLDESNKVLINMKDSVKTISGSDPVLSLTMAPEEPGITLVDSLPGNMYKFRVGIQSKDAGSAFFDIVYSFVMDDSLKSYYVKSDVDRPIEYSTKLSAEQYVGSYHTITAANYNHHALFLWIHGSYKKVNGTGNFLADEVYAYYFKNKRVMLIKGETRKNVISLIKKNEK